MQPLCFQPLAGPMRYVCAGSSDFPCSWLNRAAQRRVTMTGRATLRGRIPLKMRWVLALCLFMTGASAAMAQLPTATILGVVKDATGAVVPGAGLTTRNTETGQTRTAVSAGDGAYRFSALPVGNYEVRAEQSGFQTALRTGVT